MRQDLANGEVGNLWSVLIFVAFATLARRHNPEAMLRLIFLHSLALLSAGVQAAQPLQPWIDLTPAGQTLRLPPGVYDGPGHINKPITITGNQQAIIDGGGQGTILILNGDDIQIKGLTLRNSGDSHDALDGAIRAQGKRLLIEDNRIEAVLFGITLHQVEDSVVRRNSIRSRKAQDAAERGDALRLWNSVRNRIEDNEIAQTRDITVSNSPRNRFTGNRIHDSRRAFNFLFSHRSVVDRNTLTNNSSGIVALNSDGMLIRNNRIMHAMEASGAGIALKEISAALIQGNEIVHCAHGIMADSSTHPFNRIVFIDNLIAHNLTGVYFYGARGGHIAIDNDFRSNLWTVSIVGDGDPLADTWWHNAWDDYEGFDRNQDGVGDTPHEIHAFADRIWIETPATRFFRNAPVLELLDFLERLAPFSAPTLLLRDEAPRMNRKNRGITP